MFFPPCWLNKNEPTRSLSKYDRSFWPEDPECEICRLWELLSTLQHAPSVSGISYFTRILRHGFWLLQSRWRSRSRLLLAQLHLLREASECLSVPVPGCKRICWKLLDKILHRLQLLHDPLLPPVCWDLQQSASPAESTRYGPNILYFNKSRLLEGYEEKINIWLVF